MKPDPRFQAQPKSFWAHVRSVSQKVGYTDRKIKGIRVPTVEETTDALSRLGLSSSHIVSDGVVTDFGRLLHDYFAYRSEQLNLFVEPRLMDQHRAEREFKKLMKKHNPKCPLPMNKQKAAMRNYAFLTCIVNILIEANAEGLSCDYDPRELTTVTNNGTPLRTLARRVDGAFPAPVNPSAIWEIKEYYYTTTFGSRVADGIYETLLDGMELEELREHEGINVHHYLMIDAHYTWWECGRSYLCRIIDMLHMGYVDEVLFGYEVIERLPSLVKEWVAEAQDPARSSPLPLAPL